MVQAKSIKQNNRLYRIYKTHRIMVEVISIGENKINYESEFDFEGIPLTQEILIKSGFIKSGNIIWISLSNLKAELQFEIYDKTDELVAIIKSDFCDLILDRIKFLHQLQNTIYSLTNRELEIKNL